MSDTAYSDVHPVVVEATLSPSTIRLDVLHAAQWLLNIH